MTPIFMTVVAALIGAAQDTPSDQLSDAERIGQRYDACLTLAEGQPQKAIDTAFAWDAEVGRSALARHCLAIALSRLGQHQVAAERLEVLAEEMRLGRGMPLIDGARLSADPVLLAQIWDQAANAWLLADRVADAQNAIDEAIALTPDGTPEQVVYLLDRARIAAADGDWGLAYDDLLKVRGLDPLRRDVLLLVASAARHLNYGREAEIALDNYFVSYPDDPAGYLELGNLRDAQGRSDDARTAWRRVLDLEEQGANADAARANLQRIDLSE